MFPFGAGVATLHIADGYAHRLMREAICAECVVGNDRADRTFAPWHWNGSAGRPGLGVDPPGYGAFIQVRTSMRPSSGFPRPPSVQAPDNFLR